MDDGESYFSEGDAAQMDEMEEEEPDPKKDSKEGTSDEQMEECVPAQAVDSDEPESAEHIGSDVAPSPAGLADSTSQSVLVAETEGKDRLVAVKKRQRMPPEKLHDCNGDDDDDDDGDDDDDKDDEEEESESDEPPRHYKLFYSTFLIVYQTRIQGAV